jgi:hypothetical protein
MTPKEKAVLLYEKFFYVIPSISHEGQLEDEIAKQSALIAVNEILINEPSQAHFIKGYWMTPKTYWQEVKEELEKL